MCLESLRNIYILNYLIGTLCGKSIDPLLIKATTLKGYTEKDKKMDIKFFPSFVNIFDMPITKACYKDLKN